MSETAPTPKTGTPSEILFDRAIESTSMPPRDLGESLASYVARPAWGKHTRFNLERALEAAELLDRVQVVSSMSSARDHHDDPNPPDAKPRQR